MANGQINRLLEFANMQMAAEAFLSQSVDPIPNQPPPDRVRDRLVDGNNHVSKFMPVQAEQFTAQYEVLTQYRNDSLLPGKTGFSGTLFRNRATGELTLSIRSTEFIDDAARDNKATNLLELKELGWGFGQIAEMEAWYAQLRADPSFLAGKNFNVTGYSLGGHLATAFNILRSEEYATTLEFNPIVATYTFNGAGTGAILSGRRLTDLVADFNRIRANYTASPEWTSMAIGDQNTVRAAAQGCVDAIAAERSRVAGLNGLSPSFGFSGPSGEQTLLSYQIAVLLVAQNTEGMSNFPLPGGTNFLPTSPVYADSALRFANMTEVVGMETGGLATSFTSNSGVHYGNRQEVHIEAQPLYRGNWLSSFINEFPSLLINDPGKNNFGDTHSLVLLVDSLSLMAAMEKLAPTITIESAGQIYAAMSNAVAATLGSDQGRAEGDTLERMLDAFRKLVMGSEDTTLNDEQMRKVLEGNAWHDAAYRGPFQANLKELRDYVDAIVSVPNVTFTIDPLVSTSAAQLAALGLSTEAIAYRYALKELNPFAIVGDTASAAFYNRYNVAGELDLYNAAARTGALTPEWISDRAAFLAWKNIANTINTTGVLNVQSAETWRYADLPQKYSITVSPPVADGAPDAVTHRAVFGGDGTDSVIGGNREDRLYGGGGTDYLEGRASNDYLEGGSGFDVYTYGGATGLLVSTNDGADVIRDVDGKGVLRYTYAPLIGNLQSTAIAGAGFKLSDTQWQSPNGKFTYAKQGTDLGVTINSDAGGSLILKDWREGDFGIRLADNTRALATAKDIFGDRVFEDTNPAQEGIQTGTDALGNILRTQTADPGQSDVFFDSDQNDHIDVGGSTVTSSPGADFVFGTRGGDDRIEQTALGALWAEGGAGSDILIGGVDRTTEADWLIGGADDDWLFGDAETTLTAAFTGDQTAQAGPGDFLSGNAGNDVLVGANRNEFFAGGAGSDLIVAGGGRDFVYGDAEYVPIDVQTPVTANEDSVGNDQYQYSVTGVTGETSPAGGGADTVYAGESDDAVLAGRGDDTVFGEGGNDKLWGMQGADALVGGAGDDLLVGDNSDGVLASEHGSDYLDGGVGQDRLFGDGGDDVLVGGSEIDQLSGGDGDDLLYGGTGDDILLGGAGKDSYLYYRGDGVDTIQDPEITTDSQFRSALVLGPEITRDQVKFRLGSLMVDLGQGDAIHFNGFNPDNPLLTPVLDSIQFADGSFMSYQDVLDQGFDLDGTDGDDVISGTAVTDRIDAKGGNDTVIAKAGDDVILGGAGDDIIEGNAGNDIITTGDGADIVFGGAGNDAVFVDNGDLIVDLEGVNSLDLTAYSALTSGNLEVTQYQAPDGEVYLNFHLRDELNPGATPATGGVSVQRGERGNFATVTVNDGAGGTAILTHEQLMTQYAGHGLVYDGSGAAETLTGTPFADALFGGAGNDTIIANAGDDRIDGGAGNDTLAGGAGNDTYLLAFNGGRNTVFENGAAEPSAIHTVQLDAGIASAMVRATQVGNDLEVQLRATADALVLKDFYLQPQSWQDGWQVRDSVGATAGLAGFVPVIPPSAATWLDEQKQAFQARREQVYSANRQAEGYSALGDNTYQRTEQVYNYAGRTSSGSTTTRQLSVQAQTSDDATIAAGTVFNSTPLGQTTGSFDIGLPHARGAGGVRGAVANAFGTAGGGTGGATEFVPLQSAGFRLNPGDFVVPVYAPRAGNAGGVSNVGDLDYANAGSFNDTSQWQLAGYQIVRASGGGEVGRVSATASYSNFDQRLTVTDVAAGGANNTIQANDASVVDGGAGEDAITIGAGYFFSGPDWQAAFGQSTLSQSGFTTQFGPHPNALGGFAHGGAGADTITGSVGQDVIAGGDGADTLDGMGGSDRYLAAAADTGVDALTDSGVDPQAYLDWYYWSCGIFDWQERAEHANEWRLSEDGPDPDRFYFEAEAEADAAAGPNRFDKTFIPALPEAAPLLTRDDALYDQLIAEGVLARDVLEFGPGLTAADLAITVTVDSFSAADHPERPWINGGRVSIRWGTGGGVDLDAPALDFGHEGPSLLSGGWVQGVAEGTREDGSWRGFRLDEGIEAFRFADGTTLDIDQLLANATVVPVAGNYIFRRDSGYQLIDRRYGAVEFVDGIAPSEIAVRRDGRDLLLDAPGAQGRIRDWYADSADMPQTRLNFPFDPEIDAPTLIARGLEIHGTSRGETLTGLDGFNDVLFGEGGNDTIDGQGGNDTLSGGPDHDLLLGGSGEDELTGGLGDDALVGGAGKDTYAFNRGDGVDVITDAAAGAGDGSVIVLGPDLFLARLQPGPGTLVVNLGVAAQNETEVIHFGAFNAEDPFAAPVFDRLQFDDGSSMTYQEVLAQGFDIAGTEDNDVLNGTALVDRMQGAGGNDTLAGRAGDDLLDGGTGDDVLDGGAGADFLAGGEGNDTYVFGRGDGGDDFIMDIADPAAANPGTLDTVSFRAEVLPSEVMVSIAPDGRLFFTIMGTPDRLTIDESLGEPGRIERAVFADGTTWDRATIEARIVQEPATTLRNVITGTGGDELIDALAGDDEIYGLGSNDIIEGGIGDDYIEGNAGSDILRGGEGADGLADGQGNNFFDGGAGDDFLHADGAPNFVDGGSNFILGGAGDDWVNSYAAGNVIAFNPGDGHDSVYAVNALTLSLGGGIASSALSLSQDGIDLVLAIGVSDSIRLTRQFEADPAAWPQITLQLFGSVHFYDFNAVIADFRQAVTADPLLQEFALDGVLQGHQTAVSETEAFGGALAHLHATTGDLNGLSDTAIRQVLGAPDFGAAPQTIQIEGARPGRILIGTPDDDVLTGTEFDDVIDGLRGDDSLGGGLGSDVYRHAPKGGNDVIKETGGADTLLLGVGLAPGMVRLERRHDDLLVNLSGRDGSVTVKGWFASDAQKVETIQFADGTAWGVDYIRSHLSRVKPPQPGQDDDDHDHHHHHHGMDNDPHGKQDGGKHDDPDNDRTEHRKPNLAGLLEAYLARRPDYDFEALARELDRSNHHGEALNTHEIARRWQAVDRYVKGLADERDEDARLGAGEWRSFDAPSLLGGGLSGGAFGHAGSTGGTHGMANLKTLPGLEEGFHRLRT